MIIVNAVSREEQSQLRALCSCGWAASRAWDPAHMHPGVKAPWPAVPAEVATILQRKLSELTSEAPTDEELGGRSVVRISFGEGGPSQQQLLKYILVDVLGCRDFGQSDKTAWEVIFGFRGAACVMAFRKFGMRLEVYPPSNVTEEALRNLIGDLQEQLVSAEKLVERMVFQDFIAQQIKTGAVTVINQQGRLRGMYTYFRELTAAVQVGNGQLLNLPSSREAFLFAPQRESYFLTVAMVNAYFSMLEHLLVLMLPFSVYDPAQDDVVGFIRLPWRDKYKRVLPPRSDPGAARFYERLLDIAERFRNTHVHGGFDKNHGGIAVHCAGGALVADLAQREGKPYYEIMPVDEGDFGQICRIFDEFDLWLGTNYGYRWAEAGLSVAFDRQSIRRYQEAMVSDENFERHLDQMEHYEDNLANMDW